MKERQDGVGWESKRGCLYAGWGKVMWGTCTGSRWMLGKVELGVGVSFYMEILKESCIE